MSTPPWSSARPPHPPSEGYGDGGGALNPGHGAEAEEYGELREGSVNKLDDGKRGKLHVGGAAVAGAVLGTVLAGPIVGVVAAGGLAIAATTKGTAGNVARGAGGAVEGAHHGAKDLNEKHQITDKATEVGSTVVDHTRRGFGAVSKSARDFDERHSVGEKTKRAADATARGIGSVVQSARNLFKKDDPDVPKDWGR